MKVRKAGMVIHPVDDLDAALRFYQDAMGLELRFRDGDRFAALDAGGMTIALAAGEERGAEGVAVSYKVDDVDAAVAALQTAGARVLRSPEDGPHERRAVLRDPSGHALMLYGDLRG